MSYATGYSYLFVRCKNAKQCEYLIEQFESENQNSNWFDLYQNDHSPLKIFFSLRNCDIPSDFDEIVKEVDQWLKHNFKISLEGYWWYEVAGEQFRSEIHSGKITEASLNWLETFSVEQINKIRQYAENSFPQTTPKKNAQLTLLIKHYHTKTTAGKLRSDLFKRAGYPAQFFLFSCFVPA